MFIMWSKKGVNIIDKKQAEGIRRRTIEVDDFLNSARQVWTGRLISSSYGLYGEKILYMETDLKNKILDVIELYNKELKDKLEEDVSR